MATYVTGINTAEHFAMLMVLIMIVRKTVKVEIPWKSIAEYVFASFFMAAIMLAVHLTRLLLTLIMTAAGGIVYLTFLVVIDKETRNLADAILQEIRKTLR